MRPDPGVSKPIIQLTPLYTILLMRFYLIKLMSNVRPYNSRQTNASASTSLINVQARSNVLCVYDEDSRSRSFAVFREKQTRIELRFFVRQ